MSMIVGLDVGGAHLKVASAENSHITAVEQIACPLWQGMPHLDAALAAASRLTSAADAIAVTMTGELSDLFATRREGVETLVGKLAATYGDRCRFWMGLRGFGSATDAVAHVTDVASTNFLATATLVARTHADAMLIDMGSTTTDIIPIVGGHPVPRGLTDADRLASSELVYTGLTRTAVMGVATSAPFRGRLQGLCREYLATMADVRRILGDLPEGVDQHATADGRGKSVAESIARLARMFGRDAADGTADDWRTAATFLAEAQMQSIADGYTRVIAASGFARDVPVIVAGIGADTVTKALATRTTSFGGMTNATSGIVRAATESAPAVAVALLAR